MLRLSSQINFLFTPIGASSMTIGSKTSFVNNLQPSATFAPVKFSLVFRQTNQFVCISGASCVCSRKPFTYLCDFLLQVLKRPRLSCMIIKAKQTRCYPVRGLVDLLARNDLRSSSRFRFIGQRTVGRWRRHKNSIKPMIPCNNKKIQSTRMTSAERSMSSQPKSLTVGNSSLSAFNI